ncbi:MAG: methionine--tRNA ligase [Nanoarchaeota archaeon]
MIKFKKIVTSALPYANGSLHCGHLVEYIQTDIYVRFLRLIGEDVVYCCADDTHGAPIAIKAEQLKIKPEELIAKYNKEHLEDFSDFLIKFDSYYTTNSKENKYFSDLIFERLNKKGYIYTKEVEITFCEKCSRSLPDRYVKGKCPKCNEADQYGDVCEKCNATYNTTDLINPYCIICKNEPVRKMSKHYFFRLSAFSDKLKKWLTNKNMQPEIVNYVSNWIKEGLQDWDISRDGPYFGFKIPGEEDKYYYVWLDAPIGYISSFCNTVNLDVKKAETDWNKSEIVHFIGKDIIYFHFLFWPAVLIAADFKVPDKIVVHGFLTVSGQKMSKSRGTFYTARDFIKKFEPEYLRYYYAKVLSKKMSDINLDFDDFSDGINNELVANIGNFCYRSISFTNKFFDGEIKEIDDELITEINRRIEKIKAFYEDFNSNDVVRNILIISSLGNKYFQDNEPWKIVKTDKEKAHKVLGLCINIVKNLSILIQPILPRFAEELQKQLNLKNLKWKDLGFDFTGRIRKEKILIQKIEKEEKSEVVPLDLKVGEIIQVDDHPDADKLYVMQTDIGTEKRQIVAGIKPYYKKEELLGKKVIIVTNLKPAKLRGKESQGMLLAVDSDDDCGVLYAEKSKPGEQAAFDGLTIGREQITYEQFSKIKITAEKGKVKFKGKILKTGSEDVLIDKISSGKVC